MALIAAMTTPYVAPDPDGLEPGIVVGTWPIPPTAWGFMTTPHEQEDVSGIQEGYLGALFPESTYLEPTIGQIWPR